MGRPHDDIDRTLMNAFQRDFPLLARPFDALARGLDIDEAEVIARLVRLRECGVVSRVGGTCRPNTAGASTLAAVAAPDDRIEAVAALIGAEPGVNHSYLRENAFNIWFVATGPDRVHVDATLARIGRKAGLKVLDLRLVRPFNVDLGFGLDGPAQVPAPREAHPEVLVAGDRAILQGLSEGLDLVPRPYAALAESVGRDEDAVLRRIGVLLEAGLIGRLGVIVRHRALGWTANAMVVWEAPDAVIAEAGPRLAVQPGVTLCYQRRPAGLDWPYTLYCMIHARSRGEALATLEAAEATAGLGGLPREILFSQRCFKQRGALVALAQGDAA